MHSSRRVIQLLLIAISLLAITGCGNYLGSAPLVPGEGTVANYIVQARSIDDAAVLVERAGGRVTQSLAIINGVAAELNPASLARLQSDSRIRLHLDRAVRATNLNITPALIEQSAPSRGHETDTDGYLLYPAAATGVHTLRTSAVPTRNLVCQGKQVISQGADIPRTLLGWGVTVAVIDSGFMRMRNASQWDSYDSATGTLYAQSDEGRCFVYRDFLPEGTDVETDTNVVTPNSTDPSGHGTHVVSTIADSRQDRVAPNLLPTAVGVAPKTNLFIARALDKDGAGTYSGVIAAIDWIVNNRDTYQIRVLNLSLYAPVTGPYWADPLNQAVMRAWQAGIVVVTAAGNEGPDAGTITVPGNVPYVITVGALRSGRYNPSGLDELAAYSSRGPTESAFIKPDVLVPASRTIAPMPDDSMLALALEDVCDDHPSGSPIPCIEVRTDVDYEIGLPSKKHTYYYLSGTSMAAAEVSGVVALILQANPTLSNDEVKGRLMATARPAIDDATELPIYSPWEQGAGMIEAQAAILGPAQPAANQGMDISLDLIISDEEQTHYWGNTLWDEGTGEFRVMDPETDQVLAIWSGKSRIWAGDSQIWSGKSRIWAGKSRIWAGKSRIWAGGLGSWAATDSLWAGKSRIWAGSTPVNSLNTASHGETIIIGGDTPCGQMATSCIVLPSIRR